MKAILISINPKWVAKILNGEKTIEIRKKFPKDYVGWVYIYCTKGKPYITGIYNYEHKIVYGDIENKSHNINGKVVARFWCDKVEEISFYQHKAFFNDGYEKKPIIVWQNYHTKSYACGLLEEPSCLTYEELHDYLKGEQGKAIYITKLEIFDNPKDISEFYKVGYLEEKYAIESHIADIEGCSGGVNEDYVDNLYEELDKQYQLTKAPQSWCYVEI